MQRMLSDYKILGTTSFFCMNSLRNRGWYPAHVHPFSSGNGNADVKTKNHNTRNTAEIDPHWDTDGHSHGLNMSTCVPWRAPGHPEPRRENRVAVPAGDVAAGGGGAFRAFLGSRHEESRIQCKNQKSHPERCWDRHRIGTPAFPHVPWSYRPKNGDGMDLTHLCGSSTISREQNFWSFLIYQFRTRLALTPGPSRAKARKSCGCISRRGCSARRWSLPGLPWPAQWGKQETMQKPKITTPGTLLRSIPMGHRWPQPWDKHVTVCNTCIPSYWRILLYSCKKNAMG